jgi:hypothetical protein
VSRRPSRWSNASSSGTSGRRHGVEAATATPTPGAHPDDAPEPAAQLTNRQPLTLTRPTDLLKHHHPRPLRHRPTIEEHEPPPADPTGGAKTDAAVHAQVGAKSEDHTHSSSRCAGRGPTARLRVRRTADRSAVSPIEISEQSVGGTDAGDGGFARDSVRTADVEPGGPVGSVRHGSPTQVTSWRRPPRVAWHRPRRGSTGRDAPPVAPAGPVLRLRRARRSRPRAATLRRAVARRAWPPWW